MIAVKITPQMKAAAATYEKAVLRLVAGRPNPTNLEAANRYYYGRLVELCFESMCRQRGIPARWLGNAEGRSDGGVDFEVDARYAVQIKYTPHNGWRMMENVEERSRQTRVADYYIVIQPNKAQTVGRVLGYFTGAEVEDLPVSNLVGRQSPFHWARLTAAKPIEELIEGWSPQGRMI